MKKANLMTKTQMKNVLGGLVDLGDDEGNGSAKCKGICIADSATCPTPAASSPTPEICPPRYPKCCE